MPFAIALEQQLTSDATGLETIVIPEDFRFGHVAFVGGVVA